MHRAWGKYDKNSGEYLSLVDHCSDVAKVSVALLRLPVWQRVFLCAGRLQQSQLPEVLIQRLGVLALYHDFGKANWGFQNKDRRVGHIEIIGAILGRNRWPELQTILLFDELARWGTPATIQGLLIASLSHHGKLCSLDPNSTKAFLWDPRPDDGYDPVRALDELGKAAKALFPLAFSSDLTPLPDTTDFQHAFAGLMQLSDWLGSDSRHFPIVRDKDFADPSKELLERVGLDPSRFREALLRHSTNFIRDIFPSSAPNPMQRMIGDYQLGSWDAKGDISSGSIVLLEAETGSGKTEAALIRFQSLFERGFVDGLYFALPTRIAATQIHNRVVNIIESMFKDPNNRPPVVLAVPGYLKVDQALGQRLPKFQTEWDDDPDNEKKDSRWAAERPKKYCSATIAIGTIDQALLSSLRVKHAHLRGIALRRSLLVVDEVHASDTYMSSILKALLSHQRNAGGHAMLMSATLGSTDRTKYLSTDTLTLSQALEYPFPAISTPNALPVPVTSTSREKVVTVDLQPILDLPDRVALIALEAAKSGAKVLVVRNTVKSAINTQKELEKLAKESDSELLLFSCNGVYTLHHGRFARDDRLALDTAVESELGKSRPTGGKVVIGTQTLEQSLDIDADLLITDLCPMDVLLQRIGRLHRHDRNDRPSSFLEPRVIVMTPKSRDLSSRLPEKGDGLVMGSNGLGGAVYPDLRIIEATWRMLEKRPKIQIPSDNRLLVEMSTHPEILESLVKELGGKWPSHQDAINGKGIAEKQTSFFLICKYNKPFDDPYYNGLIESAEGRVSTRLGLNDRLVDLTNEPSPPFNNSVSQLRIPGYLIAEHLATNPEIALSNINSCETHITFQFGDTNFIYDRFGLRNER
jgi:CRISPR-associated endonuclease/helicase Cas3